MSGYWGWAPGSVSYDGTNRKAEKWQPERIGHDRKAVEVDMMTNAICHLSTKSILHWTHASEE